MIYLWNIRVVGLFLLSVCAMVSAKTYIAMVPMYFHPGWPLNIPITVNIQTGENLSSFFEATLFGKKSGSSLRRIASATIGVNSGETRLLSMKVPAVIDSNFYVFRVQLKSTGGLIMQKEEPITKVSNNSVVLVQTDKNIYKPGEMVRFRVLNLNKNTVPKNSPLNVYILNAKQIKLERFTNLTSVSGVVEREFELPQFATLGMWGIQITDEDENMLKTHWFKVDEYVLPKFSVDVRSDPEFLIWGIYNQPPAIIVNTKYTYGKGVQGDCVLTIGKKFGLNQDRLIKQIPETGIVEFTDIRWDYIVGPLSDVQLEASVKVTDVMGRTEEGHTTINVFRGNYKLEILPQSPSVIHSGLPTTYYIKISDHYNNPVTGLEAEVILRMEKSDIKMKTKMEEGKSYATVTFTPVKSQHVQDTIYKHYQGTLQVQLLSDLNIIVRKDVFWYSSKNGESVVIGSPFKRDVKKGVPLEIDVATTHSPSSAILAYFVMSQGIIVQAGPVKNKKLKLMPTIEMCPRAKVVVYQVFDQTADKESEVIVDSIDINPSMCFDKKVTVTFDTKEKKTGTDAMMQINIKDNDNSAVWQMHDVFYLAVDKSIVLLEGDTRLTAQRMLQALDDTNDWEKNVGLYFDTAAIFHDLKLNPMTDARIYKLKDLKTEMVFDDAVPMMAKNAEHGAIHNKEPPHFEAADAAKKVRKIFPETWLWNHGKTTENGQFRTQVRLPDTITNWYVSAFAINDKGIAVSASPFELTAFQPFFLALNLPYSIKKGEEFSLRITVFNYRSLAVNAVVRLELSDDYIITGGQQKDSWLEQIVTLPANLASAVTFNINATTFGKIKFHVIAEDLDDSLQRDEVIRQLIVKPAGEERDVVVTHVLLLVEQTFLSKTFDVIWPNDQKIVEKSQRLQMKVTGQIMGQSLANLGTLVRMPIGCGEQNMIRMVPNIYGAIYIQQTNQYNSMELVEKMVKHMKTGYQRQIDKYVLGDGSYSAWGPRDSQGSTWLTAFVVKSFAAAFRYINVDTQYVKDGIDFLLSTQDVNGVFWERGKVIHQEMQTGTNNGLPLTVYCLLSILETQSVYKTTAMDESISTTVASIIRQMSVIKDTSKSNPFLPALTAYTFSMIENPSSDVQNVIFELLIFIEDSNVPWEVTSETFNRLTNKNPSMLMTGAYTLMTYLRVKNMVKAMQVMKWLQQRQNQKGGFDSTQDTVLVLQALSEFGISYKNMEATGEVVVKVPNTRFNVTLDISGERSGLLQIVDLPVTADKVTVQLTGDSNTVAVVKLVGIYNTLIDDDSSQFTRSTGNAGGDRNDLVLLTRSRYISGAYHEVEACVKSHLTPGIGMYITSMYLPSGEVPADSVQTMMKENPSVSNIEVEDGVIHFYIDEVTREGSCLKAKIEQEIDFQVQLPGSTKFYSYYDPEYYKESVLDLTESVGCTGDQCDGASTVTLTSLILTVFICIMTSLLACM